jgi:hypothetical protein
MVYLYNVIDIAWIIVIISTDTVICVFIYIYIYMNRFMCMYVCNKCIYIL